MPSYLPGMETTMRGATSFGKYADIGLTLELHVRLASEIREVAEEVSEGRLTVILYGGRRRDLASMIIHGIIWVLVD